jgi:hypothetical protein
MHLTRKPILPLRSDNAFDEQSNPAFAEHRAFEEQTKLAFTVDSAFDEQTSLVYCSEQSQWNSVTLHLTSKPIFFCSG